MDGKADVFQERHLYHSHGLNRDKHCNVCVPTESQNATYLFFACLFSVGTVAQHCLISYVGGLSTSLQIMGLATIDPHSVKEHTEFHKIPKFDVNRPNNKQDTAI